MSYIQRNKDRLEQICRLYPERFFEDGVFNKHKASDIYLPDKTFKRRGAYYAQIMKAICQRKELLPKSIGLSDEEVQACLQVLVKAEMVTCINHSDSPTTLDFIATLNGEEWLQRKNKVNWLIARVETITPNSININIGCIVA